MRVLWCAPCGQGAGRTPDLAVSLESGGPRPSVFDSGPRKHNWQGGSHKCETDTCLCQTLWASAEWVLQRAKLVWRKVGQTMQSKIQQSGHFLLSRNYTNIMFLQDLHIFANEIATRSHRYSKCSFSAVPWHICGFASYKHLKTHWKTANISHNLCETVFWLCILNHR